MTKTESALIRREIRSLKSALTNRQKTTAREVKKRRAIIRATDLEITRIETETTAFTRATTDRLAILEGRLQS